MEFTLNVIVMIAGAAVAGMALTVGWMKRPQIVNVLGGGWRKASANRPKSRKVFFGLLVGTVMFLALICWAFGFNPLEFVKEYKKFTAMLAGCALLGVYLEWMKPGFYVELLDRAWRPPLFKFLSLTATTAGLVSLGYLVFDIDYVSFVEEDKTPISVSMLIVAAVGWLDGFYQASAQTLRIKEFRKLEQTARDAGSAPTAPLVREAERCHTLLGDYVRKVAAPGSRKDQAMYAASLEDRLMEDVKLSQAMAVIIPVLGLIGTVIGMKIGMVGMREASSDVALFATAAQTFINGIDTALNTTLIGCTFGSVYFYAQYQILRGGAVLLKCSMIDFVETVVVRRYYTPKENE